MRSLILQSQTRGKDRRLPKGAITRGYNSRLLEGAGMTKRDIKGRFVKESEEDWELVSNRSKTIFTIICLIFGCLAIGALIGYMQGYYVGYSNGHTVGVIDTQPAVWQDGFSKGQMYYNYTLNNIWADYNDQPVYCPTFWDENCRILKYNINQKYPDLSVGVPV